MFARSTFQHTHTHTCMCTYVCVCVRVLIIQLTLLLLWQKFSYKNLVLLDVPEADIRSVLQESVDWVHHALSSGGVVFVHW